MFIKQIILTVLIGCSLINVKAYGADQTDKTVAQAIFAGGCFWCMAPPFNELPGVIKTIAGYTGGNVKNPSYQQVSSGGTGHFEAIQVVYNPARMSYEKLLDVFWHNIDPTNEKGQFCDQGKQYRSAVFYRDAEQQRLAEQSKTALEKAKPFPEPIVTLILPATEFFPAEDYHQDYYRKNPIRYKFFRYLCGRDQRLKAVWKKND